MDATLAPVRADQDLDLYAQVHDVLNNFDLVRGSRADVEVEVADGHVTLRGAVQSPMAAVEVGRAVAELPGLTGLTNLLVDDGTLSRDVAEALATDPRTEAIPPGYQVTSVFRHVTLAGRFTNDEARAVLAVAQAVPGVRAARVKTY
ncbi:MAG: BON domain-containing protein [Anaerolineales bacterium]|nr:BON domain-containing protein [Anaerolineales bacterium]